MQYIPRQQAVTGNWTIHKAYFKPNRLFSTKTNVSDQFQSITILIQDDRSVSYTNTATLAFKQGRWTISKETYTSSSIEGITTYSDDDYLNFDWQHHLQQRWLLGKTNRTEMIAGEAADNGWYTYYLKKI